MSHCQIVVDTDLVLVFGDQRCPRLVRELERELAVPNPNHSPRRRHVPSTWCPVWRVDGHVRVGRGHLGELRSAARRLGVRLSFESRVTSCESRATFPPAGREPRPYQREAIDALVRGVQGVVVIPCGGGKTTIGALALREVGGPALVLVPTIDIADQFAETLRATGWTKVRRVGGGHRDDLRPLASGEVMVAIPDGLWAAAEDLRHLRPLLDSVAVLLLDEAHGIAAQRILALVEACPARYRWAMTATPDRPDGWHVLLPALFGPQLFSITAGELIDLGFLQAPLIIPVDTGWEPKDHHYEWTASCPTCGGPVKVDLVQMRAGAQVCGRKLGKSKTCDAVFPGDMKIFRGSLLYSKAVTDLTQDARRQLIMANLAEACVRRGRLTLALTGRKPQAHQLARYLSSLGLRAVALDSSVGKARRKEVIDLARAREIDVLVATRLADVGLDVPALGAVIVGESAKHAGRALQRAGRVCRPSDDPSRPVVYDLVDRGATFGRHWKSRRQAYAREYGERCLHATTPVEWAEAREVLPTLDGTGALGGATF